MPVARIVVRRCPACGGSLLGREGLEWFTCLRCAWAIDLFDGTSRRMETWRPADEAAECEARLPLYQFTLLASPGRPGGSRAPRIAWVNAFRVIGIQTHGDLGARLTERKHAPELQAAPLGAGLARGPGAALRILRARERIGPDDPLGVQAVRLVSLGCRVQGSVVREPVSGLVFPRLVVLPPP